jgi:hypothetical protein
MHYSLHNMHNLIPIPINAIKQYQNKQQQSIFCRYQERYGKEHYQPLLSFYSKLLSCKSQTSATHLSQQQK